MIQVAVNVALGRGDGARWTLSTDEAAAAVLTGLGLDEDVDYCTVYVSTPEPGTAGTKPEPPA